MEHPGLIHRNLPILAVVFALLTGAAGPASGAEYVYYYFHEPVGLRPAEGAVAIRSGEDLALEQVWEFLLGAGLDVDLTDGLDHEIRGWQVWDFAGQGTQEELIRTLMEHDRRDEVRDFYFAPVFLGAGGRGTTIPGDTFLLQWVKEPVPDLLREAPGSCEPDLEPEPLPSMPSAVRVRPNCHSGFDLLAYANRLATAKEVVFSEPDMIIGGAAIDPQAVEPRKGGTAPGPAGRKLTPPDDFYSASWHWNNTGQGGGQPGLDVDAPEAWDITTGSGSVVTVVLDVGVEQDHPDIRQLPGQGFTSDGSPDGGPVNACDEHGTPVAGAVSAPINESNTVGAAPDSYTRSARTFISENTDPCTGRWSTQFSWTVDALDWAQQQGARITNNSNSYDQASSAIHTKYAETHDAGMVHFASAGNDDAEGMNFPANLDSVNAVSAVNRHGNRASFSNFGVGVSVAGPGVDIYVPDRRGSQDAGYSANDYAILDGTSFASPIAAGVGALLLSRAANLDGTEVEMFLQASARDLGPAGFDPEFGWGLVNAHSALLLLDIFEDDLETGDTSRWSETIP